MKYSHGNELTAGTDNTIITVPAGCDLIVTYLYIKNKGSGSKDIDATWNHSGSSTEFIKGKGLNAKETLTFGGEAGAFLVMKEGDTLVLTPETNSEFVSILSFELLPATPRLHF